MTEYSHIVPSLDEMKSRVKLSKDEYIITKIFQEIENAMKMRRKSVTISRETWSWPSDMEAFAIELRTKGFNLVKVNCGIYLINWE